MENSQKIKLNKQSLIFKFIQFLYKPKYDLIDQSSFLKKIVLSIRLYTFVFSIIILLGIILAISLSFTGFNTQDNAVAQLVSSESLLFIILIVIFIGPISEELTFRLGLKYSNIKTALNLGLLIGLIPSFLPQNFFSDLLPRVLLTLLVSLSAFIVLKRIKKEKIQSWYTKHFRVLIYLSIFLFGIAHISNYTDLQKVWFLIPLLIAPQLLAGALFAFIRSVYGLKYSIYLHMLHNSITISPIIVLSMLNLSLDKLQSIEKLSSQDTLSIGLVFLLILIGILISFTISLINLVELFYSPKTNNRSAFNANKW